MRGLLPLPSPALAASRPVPSRAPARTLPLSLGRATELERPLSSAADVDPPPPSMLREMTHRTHDRAAPSPEPDSEPTLIKRLKSSHITDAAPPSGADPTPHFAPDLFAPSNIHRLHTDYDASGPFKHAVCEKLMEDAKLGGNARLTVDLARQVVILPDGE